MPIYDVYCSNCKKKCEVIAKHDETVKCPECNNDMIRLVPDKMTFDLKYDNKKDMVSWGAEGYSTSQYWREVNKKAKHNIFPVS